MEAYEERLEKVEMYMRIAEGKVQADRGEVLDGKTVMDSLRKKYVK